MAEDSLMVDSNAEQQTGEAEEDLSSVDLEPASTPKPTSLTERLDDIDELDFTLTDQPKELQGTTVNNALTDAVEDPDGSFNKAIEGISTLISNGLASEPTGEDKAETEINEAPANIEDPAKLPDSEPLDEAQLATEVAPAELNETQNESPLLAQNEELELDDLIVNEIEPLSPLDESPLEDDNSLLAQEPETPTEVEEPLSSMDQQEAETPEDAFDTQAAISQANAEGDENILSVEEARNEPELNIDELSETQKSILLT